MLTAAHLLRKPGRVGQTVALIDRRAPFGAGTAFGTRHPCHLLNVPAGRMSAYEDEPGHFLAWARERRESIEEASFLPRGLYGEYLRHVLDESATHALLGSELVPVTGEARAVTVHSERAGATIRFACGSEIEADAVVLALGNFGPADPTIDDPSFYETTTTRATRGCPGRSAPFRAVTRSCSSGRASPRSTWSSRSSHAGIEA